MSGQPLHISLSPDAIPTRVTAARNVPLALKEKLTAELEDQETNGLIRRVSHVTDWCSPIVVVPKKDPNKVRLTVDYRGLNKYIQREHFQSSPPLEIVQSVAAKDGRLLEGIPPAALGRRLD